MERRIGFISLGSDFDHVYQDFSLLSWMGRKQIVVIIDSPDRVNQYVLLHMAILQQAIQDEGGSLTLAAPRRDVLLLLRSADPTKRFRVIERVDDLDGIHY